MITSKEIEDYYDHPIYPDGPVKVVTPFPGCFRYTNCN